MEVLSFRQQLEAYASAQVLVMGHGAAFANIMFMPPVSALMPLLCLLLHTSCLWIWILVPCCRSWSLDAHPCCVLGTHHKNACLLMQTRVCCCRPVSLCADLCRPLSVVADPCQLVQTLADPCL